MDTSRLVCVVSFGSLMFMNAWACSDIPADEPNNGTAGPDTGSVFALATDTGQIPPDGGIPDETDTHTPTDDTSDGQADTGVFNDACEYGDKRECVTDCGTAGTQTCVKQWGACLGPDELCNGLDDDCDGQVDEDFEGLGVPCDGPDSDFCENGLVTCTADGTASSCDEGPAGIEEVCNDIDDDCNGIIDDVADEKGCYKPPGADACPDIMNESGYCLTFYYKQLAYLGLDSGQVCPFMQTGSSGGDSIAWLGTSVYHCGLAAGGLMRIDALTGEAEALNIPCVAATAYKGGVLVMPMFGTPAYATMLHFYVDEADIQTNNPQTIAPVNYYASRMTTQGDTLYTTWHATHEVDKFSLPGGQTVSTVFPQDYYDWIRGVSVTDDMRMVITNGGPVWIYDATNGTLKQKHNTLGLAQYGLQGLACVTPD